MAWLGYRYCRDGFENGEKVAATPTPQQLRRSGSGTLYAQVYQSLLAKIRSGLYRPGDRIPTEEDLMTAFGVGRATVRRALDELRRQGLVERKPALGTFVSEPPMVAQIGGVHSLTDEIVQLGMTPGSRLLAQARIRASREVSALLGIEVGADVLRLDRIRTANGRPFFVATSHINLASYPALSEVDYSSESLSLLRTYRDVLGLVPIRMTQLTSATLAPPMAQQAFGLAPSAPVLHLERAVFLEDGPAVENVSAYFRGETYKFFSEVF